MPVVRFVTIVHFRTSPGSRQRVVHRTGTLAASLTLIMALLVAGPALSALRIGTAGPETLVGTDGNDQLNGKEDGDVLKGKAGNDTYYFQDTWSQRPTGDFVFDTLVETPTGGIDTVNFRGVKASIVTVRLIPDWAPIDPVFNRGTSVQTTKPGGSQVRFFSTVNGQTVQSFVENAIGGQADGDVIQGGRGRNVLQPGGGAKDELRDNGGWPDGIQNLPGIPASSDLYQGFASNTGTDFIYDWGGTNDVLDLRPFSLDEVYIDSINVDREQNQTNESLLIETGLDSTGRGIGVIVVGQFSAYANFTSAYGQRGRIETIIFADQTLTDMSTLQNLAGASVDATADTHARLAAAADQLVAEARSLVDPSDPLGLHQQSPAGQTRQHAHHQSVERSSDKPHHHRNRRK